MATVGVKFCGNCNPQINTPGLLKIIKKRLPEIMFVGWEEKGKDALLILNGCLTGCATRPDFEGYTVMIAGYSVDFKQLRIDDLIDSVIEKLSSL